MLPIDDSTIKKAVDLLRQAAPGATVIVFGSCARGDADDHSDLDVLVVEPRLSDQWDEMIRLRRALRPLRIAADVLVVSQAVYEEWADTPNTVMYEAAHQGRIFRAIPQQR